MKLELTYPEINRRILDKTGRSVELSYGGEEKRLKLFCGIATVLVRIESIDGYRVTVSYQIGEDIRCGCDFGNILVAPAPSPFSTVGGLLKRGMQKVAAKAADIALEWFVNNPLIERIDNGNLVIDLLKISEIQKAADMFNLTDINCNENGVEVTGEIISMYKGK